MGVTALTHCNGTAPTPGSQPGDGGWFTAHGYRVGYGVFDGLTARLASGADFLWLSSFCVSAVRGHPDNGTAALEAAVSSAVPPGGQVLVLDNGHYGDRLARIADVYGIACRRLRFGWAVPIDLRGLDAALAADRGISHVAMVHHETSTGMPNPVRAAGEIVARYGRELIVDAISSVGAEDLDLARDRVGWCVGTANKALEGLPGVSFVVARRDAFESLHDGLKRAGFVIYAAQGELAGRYFRLANMGQLTPADIASFLRSLPVLAQPADERLEASA